MDVKYNVLINPNVGNRSRNFFFVLFGSHPQVPVTVVAKVELDL
jgi:hypothetical protein